NLRWKHITLFEEKGGVVLEMSVRGKTGRRDIICRTYTAGKFGLDDTGAIRIAHRFVHDGGDMQTEDPKAANYVTAVSSCGTPLNLYVEPYSFRPWLIALMVEVKGGFLSPGDTISVTIGDMSQGSPGCLIQTIAESAFQFKVSVDACATGHFVPLPDELYFPVEAAAPECTRLIAPGQRRPGERFSLGIRFEDKWGNPADPIHQSYRLTADGSITGLPNIVEPDTGCTGTRIVGLSIDTPGAVRVFLHAPDGSIAATSNPIVIDEAPFAGYWGDLHGQSGETIGISSIEEYMHFARDIAFLDVTSHQANDFQINATFWQVINDTTAALDQDGKFVVFPGYEWSGNSPVGGDHNVFFRHEGCTIRRSSHALLPDRSAIETDVNTLRDLFEALQDEDCVLFAHVGGRPANVAYAHDAKLKTAVEVHSNWGTFEWILTDSFEHGHRVGVVSNSDGHKCRPGAGSPGATDFGAYGGLTCFLAPELTRDALFASMRRRHHYGTSGIRLHMDVRVCFKDDAQLFERDPAHFDTTPSSTTEAIMGDIVRCDEDSVELAIQLETEAPIERVDILNGADEIETLRCYGRDDLGSRVKILWQGAEYRGRGGNTRWSGSFYFHGGVVQQMTPVNRWNHDTQLELLNGREIRFQAVTSGNFGGLELVFDSLENIKAEIKTNLVTGIMALAELGLEDHTLVAGGLERKIRVIRLPDELTQCSLRRKVTVPLTKGRDNPIWVRVATADGHLAWSSPIYLID
ncbi:DUF3604 domain-containing protein, partial [Paracoccaceae bacterium]|nr:DUF3604 domain-containing protein [Paracoccaceae bacterium]